MKVLIVHNFYQVSGGEDIVMENEITLLKERGNIVETFLVDNDQITSFFDRLFTILNIFFSFSKSKELRKILNKTKPDVVHVHNYFPLISPAIFYVCKSAGIPVVHTVHNYRAICPTALLMHDGKINEVSIKGGAWWAITKKVYKDSYIATLALTLMIEIHKRCGTWQSQVDRYIGLTEFSKNKYIDAGWPANKLVVKPNFTEGPFKGLTTGESQGGYALYLGRLSGEKGVDTLLSAWYPINYCLKIVGDGPLAGYVEESSNVNVNVKHLGRKEKKDVMVLICQADFVIMPSICYETFGMVIIESFACGTPVLVSRLGSMEEIVEDGVTGLHFEAGNAQDLAEKAQWLIDNPERTREMGQNARNEYLAKYTPEKNYEMLMDIYQQAIEEAKKR